MTDLTKIPGIGKNMAQHLTRAGYPNIDSLKGKDPDEVYAKDCLAQGVQVDRCALYCYRLACYFANHDGQLPKGKQSWWDWKD
ncbi:MAG: helix-hairpin-helix domain-containing protein [Oscillospiraceae bacterium]|jgi:hypothetical protein|nr:helix-hairpin-helix domain-containing protein [Oscillospiraceae bacterium]